MSGIIQFLENTKSKILRAKGILTQGIDVIGDAIEQAVTETENQLTDEQIAMARSIFGDSINYDAVIVNNSSALAEANQHLPGNNSSRPFVLGNTINSSGPLSDEIFIHEMMHIHQYQTQGWRYLPDALINGEYDYEMDDLRAISENPDYEGRRLEQFGPEQQAEIVKDYFNLQQAHINNPALAHEFEDTLNVYQPYIDEIREQRPLEGFEKEVNEVVEEIIREGGEGVEEITREAVEGANEINREISEGDFVGAGREAGEAVLETGRETAEAALETGREGLEGLGETTIERVKDIFGNQKLKGSISISENN